MAPIGSKRDGECRRQAGEDQCPGGDRFVPQHRLVQVADLVERNRDKKYRGVISDNMILPP